MKELKFSEILRENQRLKKISNTYPVVKLRLLSNVTVNQLVPILELHLRSNKLNPTVSVGDYDNIVQESSNLSKDIIPIIFWELSNLVESFVFEVENMEEEQINRYFDKVKGELDLLFQNTKNSSVVIFNKFSHLVYTNSIINKTNYEKFVLQINEYLDNNVPSNFVLIDIDKIMSKISVGASTNLRDFYLSKALYTIEFYKEYTVFTSPILFSLFSKSKKALVFDCDNTLWKGIVGEDGVDNIELTSKTKNGIYYKEIHLLAKALSKNGIILALCSKNNVKDVEEVFQKRKDMVLKYDDFVVHKINWENKASNLSQIAKELNIGKDSLVFVDDSSFEINLIKEQLDVVETFQVPENLHDYPISLLSQLNLFYSINKSTLDKNRVKMYKENMEREKDKTSFQNIEDYISSLEIKILFFNKEEEYMERIAQMTQKTNQFNLTTKRYTLNDIQNFYRSEGYDVICIDVSDKYGSSGITGLCIVNYYDNVAEIDTFLMSCRILGRNIEKVFINEIIHHLRSKNVKTILAAYYPTAKNEQVEDFYDKNQFSLQKTDINEKKYELNIEDYKEVNLYKYIERLWKKE